MRPFQYLAVEMALRSMSARGRSWIIDAIKKEIGKERWDKIQADAFAAHAERCEVAKRSLRRKASQDLAAALREIKF